MVDLAQHLFVDAQGQDVVRIIAESEQAAREIIQGHYPELPGTSLHLKSSSAPQSDTIILAIPVAEAADEAAALKLVQDLIGTGNARPDLLFSVATETEDVIYNGSAAGGEEREEGEFQVPIHVLWGDNLVVADAENAVRDLREGSTQRI